MAPALNFMQPRTLLQTLVGSGLSLGLLVALGLLEPLLPLLAIRLVFLVAKDLRHTTLV
jgi:hypothetical protein